MYNVFYSIPVFWLLFPKYCTAILNVPTSCLTIRNHRNASPRNPKRENTRTECFSYRCGVWSTRVNLALESQLHIEFFKKNKKRSSMQSSRANLCVIDRSYAWKSHANFLIDYHRQISLILTTNELESLKVPRIFLEFAMLHVDCISMILTLPDPVIAIHSRTVINTRRISGVPSVVFVCTAVL